jgi:MFS family permease
VPNSEGKGDQCMNIKAFINRTYFDKTPLSTKDYESSRRLFIYEGCTAVGVFSITSGAFLAGFAKHLGATDEFNGLIGAIPAVAGIVQIFSSLVFEKLQHRKFLISLLCFLYRLFLGLMIFIPVMIQDTTVRLIALAIMYSLAYGMAAFITPPAANWIMDLIPEKSRGSYLASKDAYSLAFVTILTLVMGRILDVYRKVDNEYGGFIILALIVIILSVLNFYFLSSIKEPIQNRKQTSIKLKNVLTMALNNKGFRKVIILSVLWNVALQVGGPFFAVYMVTGLELSYSYIMIMSIISSVTRVVTAKVWGNLADRRSWFFTTKASIAILGVSHLIWSLADKKMAVFFIPILFILGGISWAGINLSLFNIQFVYAPEEGRTAYLGTSAALGGVAGFISTFLGSRIVSLLKPFNFYVLGIRIGSMQVVFALSGILLLMTALYVSKFMEKGKYTANKRRVFSAR